MQEAGKGRIKAFLDEKDIEGGQSIPESIRTSIEQCDEFVVILSEYSKERPWVLIEMGAAWGLRKTIIAIIDKIDLKQMPDIISSYKSVDLNEFDGYISHLLRRARKSY